MSVRQGNKIIAGIPDVSGKANTDADNFTADGKQNITSWGFPSDKFIDLGRPASQTPLTAPANGYYSVDGKQTSQGGFFRIDNVTAKLSTKSQNSFSDTDQCCYMKAKKGQQIKITYFNINVKSCYFVYAEGEK